MSPLEISSNAALALSIFLAGRNSVHTWWTGIGACLLFGWLFYEAQLYADVTLQGFFIATSLVGCWQWIKGKQGLALPISRSAPLNLLFAAGGGLLVALAYGWLLNRFTNAYAPFIDSMVLAFSVIAQLLLMRRRFETWPFWLLVNTLAVPLFYSRELYLTAVLYGIFWLNALIAWRHWHRLWRAQAA